MDIYLGWQDEGSNTEFYENPQDTYYKGWEFTVIEKIGNNSFLISVCPSEDYEQYHEFILEDNIELSNKRTGDILTTYYHATIPRPTINQIISDWSEIYMNQALNQIKKEKCSDTWHVSWMIKGQSPILTLRTECDYKDVSPIIDRTNAQRWYISIAQKDKNGITEITLSPVDPES